jgi:hypothetical protein
MSVNPSSGLLKLQLNNHKKLSILKNIEYIPMGNPKFLSHIIVNYAQREKPEILKDKDDIAKASSKQTPWYNVSFFSFRLSQ